VLTKAFMSPSSRLSVAIAGLSLCLVHCSSSSAGGSGGGGLDASDATDASEAASPPADASRGDAAGDDSSAGDASMDGSADGGACPSVAQQCADAATADIACGTTWSNAQLPSTWCPKVPYVRVYTAPHCDGFDIVVLGATDTSSFYYYDLQTGALVGIEGHGNNGTLCVAGQAPGVPLTDCFDGGAVAVTADCEPDGSFTD
jgi:hypothetical protein